MNLDYPYHFDSFGRTALTGHPSHIEDMIEQFLFTAAGERVMLPEFGSGILQMVFAPNSPEVAAALQFGVQSGLQRWLGDVIEVQDLKVTAVDSTLTVHIVYSIKPSKQVRTRVFERSLI